MTLHIGIDVGGTFTDAVAIQDGRAVRGKAFSTPDVAGGILNALGVLEDQLGLTGSDFYRTVDRFVLGSTIVTNAVDEEKYSKVGLITTRGFRDTLRIARSARDDERDPHRMSAPPEIASRRRIVEVSERVDATGSVLVGLKEEEIAQVVEETLQGGAESLAVCLLWSFRNSKHEDLIASYLDEHHPEIPYTLSSRLTPVYREYERMVTTTLDAAVKPIVSSHFEHLESELSRRGLQVPVQIMQVHGGFLSVQETSKAPIAMFNSGPVGGVTGARRLGMQLGRSRLLTADMGGTSLDVAAIIDDEFRVLPRAEIGRLPTSLTAVDIETIGAGGGSIAWIDGRGVMRVGPHSAGSTPGPASYGEGGERPAVTDATLTMGLLNPSYYLGGAANLHQDKAEDAIKNQVADPLGLTAEQAAHGIYRLAVSQMANAVRKITVNRGHDPREFTLVGFGGACGLFATSIAATLGAKEIIFPRNAAVFSAYGLMQADSVFSAVHTTPWTFDAPAEDLEKEFSILESRAEAWFDSEGIPEQLQEVVREADMKFTGQIFEVTTRLPLKKFGEQDKGLLRERFIEEYEAEFGTGTAWTEAEVQLVNSRIKAVGRTEAQKITYSEENDDHSFDTRRCIDPDTGAWRSVEVYRGFTSLGRALGPCLLEEPDTTIWVPEGASAEVTEDGHFLIRLESSV